MDILIKSFNRPYYLERCLKSIDQYVEGDFTIHILDDGTPPEYLQKIQADFPRVQIHRSPYYGEKAAAIEAHVSGKARYHQPFVPTTFWVESVARASDVFLLLEDDIWLTAPLRLPEAEKVMRENDIAMLRLFWQGNGQLTKGDRQQVNGAYESIRPSIPFLSQVIFLNRFKVRSVLYRLGLLKKGFRFQLPFYTLYAVAAAFFNKAYWLHLWQNAGTTIYEPYQLKQAYQWYRQHGNRYGKTVSEIAKTSYITSATNSFEGIDLDVFRFNHYLNRAWLEGRLDAMKNFPDDFPVEYIRPLLEEANDGRTRYAEWLKWVERFKKQYRDVGCVVD